MGKKSRRRKGSQDAPQPIEVTLSRAQEVREVSLRDAAADAAYAAADEDAAAAPVVADVDIVVDDGDQAALYFSVSLWRARRLLGNNNNTQGKTSDPYVLVKYGDQEIKTRVVKESLDPVWKHHVMLEYDPSLREVELYVFDYENFSSDDLLGRITLSLPDPLPSEPAFCVLDRE